MPAVVPGLGVNVVLEVGGVLIGAVVEPLVVVELLAGVVVVLAVVVELLAGAVVVLLAGGVFRAPVVVVLLAGAVVVLPAVGVLLDGVVAVPVPAALPVDELVEAAPLADVSEPPHADSKPIRTKAETQRSALVLDIRVPQISFDDVIG